MQTPHISNSSFLPQAPVVSKNDHERARDVARQFESIFTNMMLRSMRKTVGENPLFGENTGEKIYTDMLDEEYAGLVSRHASFGLADLIFKQIDKPDSTDADPLSALMALKNQAAFNQYAVPQGQSSSNTASVADRVASWNRYINEASAQYDVDPKLVASVIAQESGGNPYAISRAGAKGLMQIMDTTAKDLGVTRVFNPRDNIFGGVKYLRQMLDKFNGDEKLALASYNAGPTAVEKYNGIPPYAETRDYVNRVLSFKETFSAQEP